MDKKFKNFTTLSYKTNNIIGKNVKNTDYEQLTKCEQNSVYRLTYKEPNMDDMICKPEKYMDLSCCIPMAVFTNGYGWNAEMYLCVDFDNKPYISLVISGVNHIFKQLDRKNL